ncbi:MAG: YfiR family protein, partial [Bacteroidia bacterium]|nr:YfiR family protein [Bacteroidia bacterium]
MTHIKISVRVAMLLCFFIFSKKEIKAQDVDYKAYTLFVYNFMKYVEWPPANSSGDFIVGVLGESQILKELQGLAATKKIKGRNIIIKKINTA